MSNDSSIIQAIPPNAGKLPPAQSASWTTTNLAPAQHKSGSSEPCQITFDTMNSPSNWAPVGSCDAVEDAVEMKLPKN
jgi:hypothetical protein